MDPRPGFIVNKPTAKKSLGPLTLCSQVCLSVKWKPEVIHIPDILGKNSELITVQSKQPLLPPCCLEARVSEISSSTQFHVERREPTHACGCDS